MRLTYRRRLWLELLREHGPTERQGHSNVGYCCHHAGWTEWAYRAPDGRVLTMNEARREFGREFYKLTKFAGERLTEEGKRILQ